MLNKKTLAFAVALVLALVASADAATRKAPMQKQITCNDQGCKEVMVQRPAAPRLSRAAGLAFASVAAPEPAYFSQAKGNIDGE